MLHFVSILIALAPLQKAPTQVGTGPEPSPNPIAWELKFNFLDPKRIEIADPRTGRREIYWYMVYTVTNPGERGQRFFPTFQIVTEDLQVINTDSGISPLVFDAIREHHKLTHKYLVPPSQAIGDLKVGDDNARESVAIWPDFDLRSNSFKVYVAGLSGETRFVRNPAFDPKRPETEKVAGPDGQMRDEAVNPKYFTLRKTLEIDYNLPGSPQARPFVEPERGDVHWIMR